MKNILSKTLSGNELRNSFNVELMDIDKRVLVPLIVTKIAVTNGS